GAIFPAMVNALLMYDLLGYAKDHPGVLVARRAIEKLLVVKDDEAYCQPCVSPVWDTALVAHALLEVGGPRAVEPAVRGLDWLAPPQGRANAGGRNGGRADGRPGGWAVQDE